MSWGELRDLDEWRGRLGLEGRVAIGPRRVLDVLLALFIGPIGGAMVLGPVFADAGLVVRTFIGLCGAVTVLAAVSILVRAVRPGPVLVVDREGISFPRLRLAVPWAAVLLAGAFHAPRNSWIQVYMAPEAIEQWRSTSPAGWLARRQVGDGFVRVSGSLTADKDHLAAWLQEEADRRRLAA